MAERLTAVVDLPTPPFWFARLISGIIKDDRYLI
jgi:hypothetical protein